MAPEPITPSSGRVHSGSGSEAEFSLHDHHNSGLTHTMPSPSMRRYTLPEIPQLIQDKNNPHDTPEDPSANGHANGEDSPTVLPGQVDEKPDDIVPNDAPVGPSAAKDGVEVQPQTTEEYQQQGGPATRPPPLYGSDLASIEQRGSQSTLGSPTARSSATIATVEDYQTVTNRLWKDYEQALRHTEKMQYLAAVLRPGGELNEKIDDWQRSVARKGTSKILLTLRPLVLLLSRRWFHAILLLLSILEFARAYISIEAWNLYWLREHRAFRMEVLETRGGLDLTVPAIATFGLLLRGCKVPMEMAWTNASTAPYWTLEFPEPVEMNGFYFVTSFEEGSEEQDPVRFRVDVQEQNGEWTPISGAKPRVLENGDIAFELAAKGDIPRARGETVNYDFRPGWQWYMGYLLASLFLAITFLVMAALGFIQKEIAGLRVMQISLVVIFIMRLSVALGYATEGKWEDAVWWLLFATSCGAAPFLVDSAGRKFLNAVVGLGAYLLLIRSAGVVVFFGPSHYRMDIGDIVALSMVLFGLVLLVFRLSILKRAQTVIAGDSEKYRLEWNSMLDDRAKLSALYKLRELERMVAPKNTKLARQYNAKASTWNSGVPVRKQRVGLGAAGRKGTKMLKALSRRILGGEQDQNTQGRDLNWKSPVNSLDQLYAQARGIDIVLRHKVHSWAYENHGYFFPIVHEHEDGKTDQHEFVSWVEAMQNRKERDRVKWCPIKGVDRAIEKLLRCYQADVSRLLDLCRQTIIFDTIEDLSFCLSSIYKDEDIMICRIKNYLDPNYDGKMSAGFRAVVLNLRICTDETMRLCIDTHVCELVLRLKCFTVLEDNTAHARYIQFRNDWPERRKDGIASEILNKVKARQRAGSVVMTPGTPDGGAGGYLTARSPSGEGPGLGLPYRNSVNDGTVRGSFNDGASHGNESNPTTPSHNAHHHNGPMLQQVVVQQNVTSPTTRIDQEEEKHEVMLLENHYRESSDVAAGSMQKRVAVVFSAMQHANDNSVAFTSKAAAAIISKRKWQFLLWVAATGYLARSISSGTSLYETETSMFKRYRFHNLKQRDGMKPDAVHVESFGILHHGCKVPNLLASGNRSAHHFELTFPHLTPMNGFYFKTSATEPEKDPVSFRVEGIDDDLNDDWTIVGSSSWRIQASAQVVFLNGDYNTPRERSMEVMIYPKVDWPWLLVFPCVQGLTILFCYLLVVYGVIGQSKFAHIIIASGFAVVWILQVVGALGFLIVESSVTEFLYWLLFSLSSITMSVVLGTMEKNFIFAMAGCGSFLILLDVIFNAAITQDLGLLWQSPPYTGGGFFLVGVINLIFRVRNLTNSRKLIEADQKMYDSCWAEIVQDPDANQHLLELAEIVQTSAPKKATLARQYTHNVATVFKPFAGGDETFQQASLTNLSNALEEHHAVGGLVGGGFAGAAARMLGRDSSLVSLTEGEQPTKMRLQKKARLVGRLMQGLHLQKATEADETPGNANVSQPLASLDQLYAQASGIDVILKSKVKVWASKSEGYFAVAEVGKRGPPEFVKWSAAVKDRQIQSKIKWGKIKGVDRAIEKLLRSYKADVSKLLDVCRQSIIFDSIESLKNGFMCIIKDPDVKVVRVKNRLDPNYDSTTSAGYRDVVLNVRLLTKRSRDLRIDTHVCEVQLLLMQFARLKHEEGHKRYKEFRNQRAE